MASPASHEHLVTGIVLAAGAGTRFGGPKGLARTADGEPWVQRAAGLLRDAGCGRVLVTVGARSAEVTALLPDRVEAVAVPDWEEGLAASVRAGLRVAAGTALILTVDTPSMPIGAVRRILQHAGADALAQATYEGAPGHPVLIGAAHTSAVAAALTGDRGAGPYLRAHGAQRIECGDLWNGADIDVRA